MVSLGWTRMLCSDVSAKVLIAACDINLLFIWRLNKLLSILDLIVISGVEVESRLLVALSG